MSFIKNSIFGTFRDPWECDHSTNLHLRQEGVPRTFKEIVAVSTVNKRDIGRCFKIILKWHEDTKVGLVDSGDFMSR